MKYCLFILLLFLMTCKDKKSNNTGNQYVKYSFFVAGHVYGAPGRITPGIYPPFKAKFNDIENNTSIKFGVFTGDIVMEGKSMEWDEVDKEIAELSLKVYFAIGNHDDKNRDLFLERYGNTYYSFTHEHDLFIVLDPNIDNWNISGKQLDFLMRELSRIDPAVKNVFVFFHQLLWWSPGNCYKNVKPNSLEARADSINFWSTVEPLFREISANVVMFAGDVGAASWSADYMYHHYDNITFIASGMGEGIGDNYVIVDVMDDNTVAYRLVPLNCEDSNCLGKLEEFVLP